MKVLLDTHAFLWAITEDARLSEPARQIFLSGANQLFLSVASLWEIVVKVQIGKLPLPKRTDQYLLDQLSRNAVQTLPVQASHVLRLFKLPHHHSDPFDRVLIAQSQAEGLPILTADPLIRKYPVKTMW